MVPEIGPDGIARESPAITNTERVIEAEQIQLKKYIQENYSKIRDVEKDLESLTLELKLTAGPKKAALEHMRKKIEASTEKIRIAKLKEDQARKALEEAAKVVKDEEAIKQKLCDDLNQLVQESSSTQLTRLEELKKRLVALNPSRASCDRPIPDEKTVEQAQVSTSTNSTSPQSTNSAQQTGSNPNTANASDAPSTVSQSQIRVDGDGRSNKKMLNLGRGKGNIVPKGRGTSTTGWTGSGFDVDGRA